MDVTLHGKTNCTHVTLRWGEHPELPRLALDGITSVLRGEKMDSWPWLQKEQMTTEVGGTLQAPPPPLTGKQSS